MKEAITIIIVAIVVFALFGWWSHRLDGLTETVQEYEARCDEQGVDPHSYYQQFNEYPTC